MKRRIGNKKAINKKLLSLRRPPRLEGEIHKFGIKPVKKGRRK
ncbi:MAG: hypothetical protein PHF45_00010 [Candidatus Pacebacteria bacterium]|nr:hypothetical protein [Candidatus Paceibacterota bacterium]